MRLLSGASRPKKSPLAQSPVNPTAKRFFDRIKHCRCVAMRYKLAAAFVQLASDAPTAAR
jgi:hypothetical protein